MSGQARYHRPYHLFAVFTAAATLALIGMGGIVTSKGVGMSVPDWPDSYDHNMFMLPVSYWVGGIFWEHFHRLAASAVGLLTVGLAVWSFGRNGKKFLVFWLTPLATLGGGVCLVAFPERLADTVLLGGLGIGSFVLSRFWPRGEPAPRLVRILAVVAVVAVIGQGVLGGLRVRLLQDELGAVHAAVAHLFLVLICVIALLTSRWWQERGSAGFRTRLPGWTLLLAALLIFGQLLLGAAMRHRHAGLPVDSFPLVDGKLLPAADETYVSGINQWRNLAADYREFEPVTRGHVQLYRYHLILGSAVFLTVLASLIAAWLTVGNHWLVLQQGALVLAIVGQGLLGAWTVWSDKADAVATLHVVFGAIVLVWASLLAIIGLGRFPAAGRDIAEKLNSSGKWEMVSGQEAIREMVRDTR